MSYFGGLRRAPDPSTTVTSQDLGTTGGEDVRVLDDGEDGGDGNDAEGKRNEAM
jgi:hypothetical protein